MKESKLRNIIREQVQVVLSEDIGNQLLNDELMELGLQPERVAEVYISSLHGSRMTDHRQSLFEIEASLKNMHEDFERALDDLAAESREIRDYHELDKMIQKDVPEQLNKSTVTMIRDAAGQVSEVRRKLDQIMKVADAFK